MIHPLLKQDYIDELRNDIAHGRKHELYFAGRFKVSKGEILESVAIEDPGELKLFMPSKTKDGDYENAKLIFEAYKNLTPDQASDTKLWTYLTHVRYWKYMKKRWPIEELDSKKLDRYILEHWHLNGANATTLVRQGISWLWWGSYLTYDANSENPYALTKELFSMKDYTRTFLPSIQGRNNDFLRAVLKFVLENPIVFKKQKETKVRLLSRFLNRKGGHMLLPILSEKELMAIFRTYVPTLQKVTGRASLHQL